MKNIEIIVTLPSILGHHLKAHECQGICTENEGVYTIQLLQTKRWFDEHKFCLIPGDLLSAPESDRVFTVTHVSYLEKRPKYAVITAALNKHISDRVNHEVTGGLAS